MLAIYTVAVMDNCYWSFLPEINPPKMCLNSTAWKSVWTDGKDSHKYLVSYIYSKVGLFFPTSEGIRNPWCQVVHYWGPALGLQDPAKAALLSWESKLTYFYVIVPYIYSTALRPALGSLVWAVFLVQWVFSSSVTYHFWLG